MRPQRKILRDTHLVMLAAAILFGLAVGAYADEVRLSRAAANGYPYAIEGYSWVDPNCELSQLPPLNLDEPPKHGIVCYKIQDGLAKPPFAKPSCAGRMVKGATMYYL